MNTHDTLDATDDSLAVAIIGLGGRFPDAAGVDAFWANLRDGVESIRQFTRDELAAAGVGEAELDDPHYVRAAALIDGFDRFDAGFFGMTPRESEITDPQQRIFLETCWHALEDAGYAPKGCAGTVGVYAGVSRNAYFLQNLIHNDAVLQSAGTVALSHANDKDFLSTRVAYHLDLRGPAVVIQTACSTSLVAVHMACQAIVNGECDMALAGGVSIGNFAPQGYPYVTGGIGSPDGHCRAFDAQAAGTVYGNGTGVVVLKSLAAARRDGDAIQAVIRGSAINNDGAGKVGFTAPSVEGQVEVISQALAVAGVGADTISYVEAHGTGTALGDPIEVRALNTVFAAASAKRQYCTLGALKPNIGHLDVASGVAGLIKVVLALRHGEIPGTLHYQSPNPLIDLANSAFVVSRESRPWPRGATPRRAGVSSFGIGGTNAHVIVEEAPPARATTPGRAAQLLVLSARSDAALRDAERQLGHWLEANPDVDLADLAYTSQVGRTRFEHRRALACTSVAQAIDRLAVVDPARGEVRQRLDAVVFAFPGQGTQHVGMARDLYLSEPVFKAAVDACSVTLLPALGLDLRDLLYPAPGQEAAAEAQLQRTRFTQPALFVVEYALCQLLADWRIRPDAMLGHSVGEIVAACIAGVFPLDAALRLVAERGRLVDGLPAGAMLAVHAPETRVRTFLGAELWIAAVNAPTTCSVSGTPDAIARLAAALDAAGIAFQTLATSHGFHCALLDPVADAFAVCLAGMTLAAPTIPFLSNVSGTWITAEQATSPAYWLAHLRQPVRFADNVQAVLQGKPAVVLEVGPGQALTRLLRNAATAAPAFVACPTLPGRAATTPASETLLEAVGTLWSHGKAIEWTRLHRHAPRRRTRFPGYPFQRQRYWIDASAPGATPAVATLPTMQRAAVRDWFYALCWKQSSALPRVDAAAGAMPVALVFVDAGDRCRRYVEAERQAGVRVVQVRRGARFGEDASGDFVIDGSRADDYTRLFDALRARALLPARISHFWALATPFAASGDQADFAGLLLLAQALGRLPQASAANINVIADGVCAVTGNERLAPEKATLLGPSRVIPLEYPQLECRFIDIELDADGGIDPRLVPHLQAEIRHRGEQRVVAYRGTRRWSQVVEPLPMDASTNAVRNGGHYLVTGGLGGIGLAFANYLAGKAAGVRLTLVGRSPLPDRSAWDAILARPDDAAGHAVRALRALEARGADVMYVAADIASDDGIAHVRATAHSRFGAVDGVFHAAGLPGDALIQNKSVASARGVMAPKLEGTLQLQRAFAGDHPAFVVLCSSLNALQPAAGQVDYCAANAFLDAQANAAQAMGGGNVIAVNWSAWRDAGMAVRALDALPGPLRQAQQQHLRDAISLDDAPAVFDAILAPHQQSQVLVSPFDLVALTATTRRVEAAEALPAPLANGARHARPELRSGFVAPRNAIEADIAGIWTELFGIEAIGVRDDFFEMGGHSLLAVQLVSRLRQVLGIEIALDGLFAHPTIESLAIHASGAQAVETRALATADRTRPLPLSWAQERLWFLDQLDAAASAAYHIPFGMRLAGTLDVAALRATLDRIVARHESLRTTFVQAEDALVQHIAPADVGFALRECDLSGLEHDARQAAIARIGAEEAAAPFDLARGPLIRGQLLRLSATEHVLLVTQHHIVSDGWSIGLLVGEVTALYAAFCAGGADPLPALAIQYADYAAWQRHLHADVLQEQLRFWREHLDGAPALLELPTDRPRPARQSYAGGKLPFALPDALSQGLRELGQRHGTTLFMTLLAGWAALLSRLSGQGDLVLGIPVAGRHRAELEPLIGFFVNTLALRVRPTDDLTVRALLEQVKTATLAAYAHQDLPFEQLVEAVNPTRSLSHSPLFQATAVMNNTPVRGELSLSGLVLEPLPTQQATTHFDLSLSLSESDSGIDCSLEFSSDLFAVATIERFAESYRVLLEGMVADDACALARLPLLRATQRDRLLLEFNDTARDYPRDSSLHAEFERVAKSRPDAIAVSDGARTLRYDELDRHANRLAQHLRALEVQPGDRVAISLPRGADLVIGLLGILKAGAAYVPVDPAYPAERIQHMLHDSAPKVLVTEASLRAGFAGVAVPLVLVDADAAAIAAHADAPLAAASGAAGLAYVIYTSGSTGQPKGVMLGHRSVLRLVTDRSTIDLDGDDCLAHCANPAFDAAAWEIWVTLLNGARLLVVPQAALLDADALRALLQREAVTTLHLTVGLFNQHAQALAPVFRTLKTLLFGGEQSDAGIVAGVMRDCAPRRLVHCYGPTEATTFSTTYTVPTAFADLRSVPIGRPLGNTRIYVLDAALQPVPIGVRGEICIGGDGLAEGYMNQPELTASRFIADPFAADAGARMYRTGDLGRWREDGTLDYLGRNDTQIKIRGFRIEPGEVEAQLAACEGVREAAVLAREDVPGTRRLVAYVVGDEGAGPSAIELRAALSRRLPDYMVPSAFVVLAAFPLTPNGKLDRRALPAPDHQALATTTFESPQGPVEEALAVIWQELLGLEHVGRHDDFFALGGHSLLAVRVISAVRSRLGLECGLSVLFQCPTLAAFAAAIADSRASTLTALVPADRGVPLPLSWAQQRLWFLDQLDNAAGAAYHIPFGMRLTGALDVAALRATLDRIVARHENLRTTFVHAGAEPVQRIADPGVGFALHEHDLSGLAPAAKDAEVARLAAEEAADRFDLASGPLIRGQLLRLSPIEHVLLVTQHHIISDGWSIGVLIAEVSALYAALRAGAADPLPPLAIQYADYAVWQRQWLQGDVLQQQLQFWREHLDGAPALLELPTDRPRPALQGFAGGSVDFTLPADLVDGLRTLGQRHGATLFMTLLAGWATLLSRLSGQDEVVVGTPVANRQRAEVEPLIGFFINTLALRISLRGEPDVAGLVRSVRDASLAAHVNQDVPFEQVVEALKPVRDMSHSPLFQTMLSLDNTPRAIGTGFSELDVEPLSSAHATAHFDLVLLLEERDGVLAGSLEYASSLFDESTVRRTVSQLRTLLADMVADDARPVAQLALLDDAEREQLIEGFNDTARDYPRDTLIHELIEAQVAAQPDAIAVEFPGEQLDYATLNRRANQLAHHLVGLGVRPGSRVAICLERGIEMVVGVLGILKAGGAYVPLDPDYPADRLAYMLEDSDPVVLLTHSALVSRWPALALAVVQCDRDADRIAACAVHDLPAADVGVCATDLAYVIYTSGSTGLPKGVMEQHRPAINLFDWVNRRFAVGPGDRLLFTTSLCFDLSVYDIFGVLAAGGTVRVASKEEVGDPRRLLEILHGEAITFWDSAPAVFGQLLPYLDERADRRGNGHLRLAFFSGDWIPLELPGALRRAFPNCQVIGLGGATEATVWSNFFPVEQLDPAWTSVPYGRPIQNARYHVLDAQLAPCPIGVAGDLYIGGECLSAGYFRREELTAQRYLRDPFSTDDAARLYKTGDRARYWADGNLEFLGRLDSQVKIRGFRIELGEIEARLGQVAGVREALVVTRADATGEKRLVAYVLAGEGEAPTATRLRAHLAQQLPEYMVPSAFVVLDAFPLTPNGKVDRQALPAPDGSALALREYAAPVGPAEELLATVWQDLLGVAQVGRDDHFFELGGHSLLAIQLTIRIRAEFGVDLPLATLFRQPQLDAMAACVVALQVQLSGGDIESMQRELEALSEAELMAILANEDSNEQA